MSTKKNWEVRMKCGVTKLVYLQGCTEEEARENPWDYAVDEQETEQFDWEVQDIKEAE